MLHIKFDPQKIYSFCRKMSRIVRLGERMIDLRGLYGIWLGADHLCNSKITLFYPNGPTQTIQYKTSEWSQAEKDKDMLENAKKEFDKTQALSLDKIQ
jgi:hypothetical protein